MVKQSDLVQLGFALRVLAMRKIENKQQLADWENEAWQLRSEIKRNIFLANVLPHQIWHYLDDADIRLKDPRYYKIQQSEILTIIDMLESGRIPE